MNKTIYRQYDSRWSSLPYPYGNSTMYGCGCGCVSILHCLLEVDKYKKYTPKTIQPYMKQFAVYGQGTLHSGIPTALKHYGFKSVKESGTMGELWKELAKGNRVGVLLFGSRRGPDGTVWTTGGHFIAFVGYKVKDGKHYLYLKDSGGRKHDGWYCYEKSMKGDVLRVWSAEIPVIKAATKTTVKTPVAYSGTYPTLSSTSKKKTTNIGSKIVAKATEYCWPKGTPEKKWAYKTGAATSAYKKALKKYLNKSSKITQSDCGYFVSTCVRAAGIDSSFMALAWSNKLKSCFKVVQKGKAVDKSKLLPGDIIRYKRTDKNSNGTYKQHTLMFYGNGCIAEGGRGIRFPIIRKDTEKYNGKKVNKSTIQVLRPVKVTTVTTVNPLIKGNKGDEVLKWQKYLIWYFGKKVVAEDGDFGTYTEQYTKKFQEENKLTVNGKVDEATLAKAKKIKK